MSYTVKYSKQAREDIQLIYEYIAFRLLSPDTAAAQIHRIYKTVRSLDEMPMRFRLYEDEPWHSKGLRVAPINNYGGLVNVRKSEIREPGKRDRCSCFIFII